MINIKAIVPNSIHSPVLFFFIVLEDNSSSRKIILFSLFTFPLKISRFISSDH